MMECIVIYCNRYLFNEITGEMLRESQKGEHSRFIWKIVEKQLQSLVCMQDDLKGIVFFLLVYQVFIAYTCILKSLTLSFFKQIIDI